MRIVKAEEKFRRQQRSPKHLCPLASREEKLGKGGKRLSEYVGINPICMKKKTESTTTGSHNGVSTYTRKPISVPRNNNFP
jgi:hypothetical protein